jgi:site-specific recombinase XerD
MTNQAIYTNNLTVLCATRAGLTKHVTAHTLRHTAATWLRQTTGDTRLVAEYLGHADLSTVSRYAHITTEEMHTAVQALADHAPVPTESAGSEPQAKAILGIPSP